MTNKKEPSKMKKVENLPVYGDKEPKDIIDEMKKPKPDFFKFR